MDEIREEEGISLLDIFEKIKQNLLFIVICLVTCIGVMGVYSTVIQKPEYQATSSVFMSASEVGGTGGASYALNIIDSYEEFMQSRKVSERAEEIAFNNSGIQKGTPYVMSIGNNGNLMVYITITSYEPEVSIALANAFVEAGNDIIAQNPEGMKSLLLASPTLIDEANEENVSTQRNLVRNCVVGAAIGIVIACAYIFIRMLIDNTFTKSEEIERELGLPVLATIPLIKFNELDSNGNLVKKSKK